MKTRPDFQFLNKDSRTFLSRGYLESGVTPEDRYLTISNVAEQILGIPGFAEKFYGYIKKGYYSLATPVLTNFGAKNGLPVSCFGSRVEDTLPSILGKAAEVGMMSKGGGGTSADFGAIRPRGSKISAGGESSGPVHFMEIFDSVSETVSQGSTRRGSFAAYLPVEHPDVLEFLKIRSDGHKIQNISIGVTITDEWMREMTKGCPDKRKIWSKIIQKRCETGYPYLFFTDTVNNNSPQVYKDLGMKILASNLCSEICLPSSGEESFTCVLSSLNLLYWDEIKETDAVECLVYFLDAVNEEFVKKSAGVPFMRPAHLFAKNHRALGMGVLGWHSLLQSKMIAFESMSAKMLNLEVFQELKSRAEKASQELAIILGEPSLLVGKGRRNTTLIAIAPTTSSSFILGQVSPSIEPLNSNYFVKDLAKGKFTYTNPFLRKLLVDKDQNTEPVWESILLHGGSVQHLSFLSEEERAVFKTFGEISQKEIVIQAASRQKFIDQSQSLNLMIPPSIKPKEISDLLIEGWRLGIKTFYYQRSANPAQELSRSIMTCKSCEG